jgi:hypothetical protein
VSVPPQSNNAARIVTGTRLRPGPGRKLVAIGTCRPEQSPRLMGVTGNGTYSVLRPGGSMSMWPPTGQVFWWRNCLTVTTAYISEARWGP